MRTPAVLPNEDSQSLEFDDTTLFKWDKFAGYDRQEGGTRANLGFLYQGLFPNGASIDAIVGRSYPARRRELLRAPGPRADRRRLGAGDQEFRLRRARHREHRPRRRADRARPLRRRRPDAEPRRALGGRRLRRTAPLGIDYTYLRESPASGIFNRREELSTVRLDRYPDNWSVLGSLVYDLRNDSRVSDSLGLAYADDCFSFSATYSETTDPYSDLVSERQIFFRVSLRTVADGGFGQQIARPTIQVQ